MEYRPLGKSNIKVSALCLGTMTFGEQNSEKEAHEQCDMAFEYGVNFFDTAEMYPVPPMAESVHKTEMILGTWDKLKNQREKIILATKVAAPSEAMSYIRGGRMQLTKKNIREALEKSLQRLKTDYVDLYQVHWPERQTNFFGQLGYTEHHPETDGTDLLETLEGLDELVKEGKIRTLGISNETPWGTMRYLELAKTHNLPRVVSIQNPYNLLNRSFEVGLSEIAWREQVGLLAYSPMAFGVLSGKYLGGKKPDGARLTLWDRFSRYTGEKADKAVSRYVEIAKDHGLSPAQMSLAFVTSRGFVTSNIIGATKLSQLEENLKSADIFLSDEALSAINAVHQEFPNPCP